MEIGEVSTLHVVDPKIVLAEAISDYLTVLLAGETFLLSLNNWIYLFSWDLPHMQHRSIKLYSGFEDVKTIIDAQENKQYQWLEGTTAWGILTIRRAR